MTTIENDAAKAAAVEVDRIDARIKKIDRALLDLCPFKTKAVKLNEERIALFRRRDELMRQIGSE